MIVVSDASPLITLAGSNQLGLLHALFGTIVIPQAVHDEVTGRGDRPGAAAVRNAEWITRQTPADRELVQILRRELDAGESEAIALAVQLSAGFLLMDEPRGRRTANRHGVKVIGVLGIVIAAKGKGLIPSARELLAELKANGYRVSSKLEERLLASISE